MSSCLISTLVAPIDVSVICGYSSFICRYFPLRRDSESIRVLDPSKDEHAAAQLITVASTLRVRVPHSVAVSVSGLNLVYSGLDTCPKLSTRHCRVHAGIPIGGGLVVIRRHRLAGELNVDDAPRQCVLVGSP
jgi:hypothetical protein